MIKVLATGSTGNCYIIQVGAEKLLLECGIAWKEILKGLDFDLSGVVGCLLTHVHKDHSKALREVLKYGVDIYTNNGTLAELELVSMRRINVKENEKFKIGNFTILSFQTEHTHNNGERCPSQGFLIHHPQIGKILFATDTYYLKYKFKDVDHILIECNYSEDILEELNPYQARLLKSHISLETLKETLKTWDLSKTKDITLIHISETNGDGDRYKEEIEKLTGIKTNIAVPGLEIGKQFIHNGGD